MEIKHAIIENDPLVNRVELHNKGNYFLVVTGNYPGVIVYKSPHFIHEQDAINEYEREIALKTIELPAKHFERCNDLIYTRDFISFYMEDCIEIKNVSYLKDIRQSYAARIARVMV